MPKNQLTSEQINTMKLARDEYIKRTTGCVWKIDERAELWADEYQYILRLDGAREYYYATLDQALVDLVESRLKERLVKNVNKDVDGMLQALSDIYEWIRETLKGFDSSELMKQIKGRS